MARRPDTATITTRGTECGFATAVESDRLLTLSDIAAAKPPERVLVVAPSNAAIDEVALRLCTKGIMNGNGLSARPPARPQHCGLLLLAGWCWCRLVLVLAGSQRRCSVLRVG